MNISANAAGKCADWFTRSKPKISSPKLKPHMQTASPTRNYDLIPL